MVYLRFYCRKTVCQFHLTMTIADDKFSCSKALLRLFHQIKSDRPHEFAARRVRREYTISSVNPYCNVFRRGRFPLARDLNYTGFCTSTYNLSVAVVVILPRFFYWLPKRLSGERNAFLDGY